MNGCIDCEYTGRIKIRGDQHTIASSPCPMCTVDTATSELQRYMDACREQNIEIVRLNKRCRKLERKLLVMQTKRKES